MSTSERTIFHHSHSPRINTFTHNALLWLFPAGSLTAMPLARDGQEWRWTRAFNRRLGVTMNFCHMWNKRNCATSGYECHFEDCLCCVRACVCGANFANMPLSCSFRGIKQKDLWRKQKKVICIPGCLLKACLGRCRRQNEKWRRVWASLDWTSSLRSSRHLCFCHWDKWFTCVWSVKSGVE